MFEIRNLYTVKSILYLLYKIMSLDNLGKIVHVKAVLAHGFNLCWYKLFFVKEEHGLYDKKKHCTKVFYGFIVPGSVKSEA